MTLKWVEITITLVGEDYKQNVDAYHQRINYEYFQQARPTMIAEIIAVVNDLKFPAYTVPKSPQEIDMEFDKEYSLYKDRIDNPKT